jgi:hypothetical protein
MTILKVMQIDKIDTVHPGTELALIVACAVAIHIGLGSIAFASMTIARKLAKYIGSE